MKRKIVLFDGVCNLCNASVNFILDRDKEKKFHFSPLQSDKGKELLESLGAPQGELSTLIFVEGDRVFTKSTAVLNIARHLDGIWKLGILFLIVPRFLRDAIYLLVAKNRYRWFGKKDHCRIPTPDTKDRFL